MDDEPNSALDEAALGAKRDQLQAAQRDRQEALRTTAQDAGVYRDELIKAGFEPTEARYMTEHMLGWYFEAEPPWDS